jgi:hypothetical protein
MRVMNNDARELVSVTLLTMAYTAVLLAVGELYSRSQLPIVLAPPQSEHVTPAARRSP